MAFVNSLTSPLGRSLLVAGVVWAGGGSLARAQPEEEAEDQPPKTPARLKEAKRALVESERLQAFYRAHFDRFRAGALDGDTEFRAHLERLLSQRIGRLVERHDLTGAQAKKLDFAGKGDIKRFTDRVESLSKKLDDPTVDMMEWRRTFIFELNRLQTDWNAGPFGEGSLFRKMLITTLNSEQLVLGRSPSADEIRRRYGRAIAIAARSLERNLGLSPGQRDRVTRLVPADHP
jgi:hypothetical protein